MRFRKVLSEYLQPENWSQKDSVSGKLYRFADPSIDYPLIEIMESERPKLEGYDYFEPDWVIARSPTLFAIYDREEALIFGPNGFAENYSLAELLNSAGYGSLSEFEQQYRETSVSAPKTDMDVWVKLGLPARVFLPSLKKKIAEA